MEKISDDHLVRQIKAGDMAAFELLVKRHKDFAYLIAYRVVRNAEDAEEIAHDAFIRLLDKISGFKGDSKFTSWFYRMVINLAIGRTRKKRVQTDDIDQEVYQGTEPMADSGLTEMNKADQKLMLARAIDLLNDEERVLITLYYYDELSMEEMEEITGLDKNLMKVKIFRARKKMAKTLTVLLNEEIADIY